MPNMDGEITVEGLDEMLWRLDRLDDVTKEEFRKVWQDAVGEMKAAVQDRVKVFTGSTARSIRSSVRVITGDPMVGTRITGRVDPAKSGKLKDVIWYMQEGRTPGKEGPPVADLIPWLQTKLGAEGDPRVTAFAVSKSIGKQGTKKYPVFQPVLEAKKSSVMRRADEAIRKIVESLKI